jgi:hypothetical protein
MQNKLNIENQKYRYFPIETQLVKECLFKKQFMVAHGLYEISRWM